MVSTVVAVREYEAWFLAAIESLRGTRGIRLDATSHTDPESPRDAKGELQARMGAGRVYAPTVDQAALTQQMDLATVHRRCRSFRRMVRVVGELVAAMGGVIPPTWSPEEWQTDFVKSNEK